MLRGSQGWCWWSTDWTGANPILESEFSSARACAFDSFGARWGKTRTKVFVLLIVGMLFFVEAVCVLVPSEAVVASKYKNKVESFSVAAIRPKDLFRRSGKR